MSRRPLKTVWAEAGIFAKGFSIVASVFVLLFIFSPIIPLVLNTTVSMPRGLYYTFDCEPQRGDLIQFRPAARYWTFALERGYVAPRTKGLLKEVAASSGDLVCWNETHILINGQEAGLVMPQDSKGRILDHPRGCSVILADEFLPLAPSAGRSYDGRYFGPIKRTSITQCLSPLLTERP